MSGPANHQYNPPVLFRGNRDKERCNSDTAGEVEHIRLAVSG